jgi:hypothetical protein
MFRYAVDLARDKVYRDVLDLAGGNASVDGAALDLRAFQHNSAGCDDGVAADLGIVHDDGAHADENFIAEFAAVYDSVVTDGDVVANKGLGLLVSGVYDHAVLYVYFIADADAVDVAAYDGIEPDTYIIADLDVSYHSSIRGDKAIFSKFGEFPFDGKDSGHGKAFSYTNILKNFQ